MEKGCYNSFFGSYNADYKLSQSILIVEKGCYINYTLHAYAKHVVTIHSDSGKGLLQFTKKHHRHSVNGSQSILIVEKGCYMKTYFSFTDAGERSQSILIVEKGCYCVWQSN